MFEEVFIYIGVRMAEAKFDMHRVEKALYQESRKVRYEQGMVADVVAATVKIAQLCGDFSQNRKMALRIGTALLSGSKTIITPLCLDFGNLADHAEFVSNFVQKQIRFLDKVHEVAPSLVPIFVFAEQEMYNKDLMRICSKSADQLQDILRNAGTITEAIVRDQGWKCQSMIELIPDIVEQDHRQSI